MIASRPVAAIDIGTNSVLMLIAERATNAAIHPELRVLVEHAQVTRLGRGVDQARWLQQTAIDATLQVLERYAVEARAHGARIVAVGTSALRDASNADAFLVPAHATLGSEVQILGGLREAELTFAGALEGLSLTRDQATVIDVGGGSTEVVRVANNALQAVSIDIGAVRLTERFALTAPTAERDCQRVLDYAREALRSSHAALNGPLVATAGTATTLAAIAGAIDPFDPLRIHGTRLSLAQLRSLSERLAALTHAERAATPGLGPQRADIVVAGALILIAACELGGAAELRVSCGGLRVGLARELLFVDAAD